VLSTLKRKHESITNAQTGIVSALRIKRLFAHPLMDGHPHRFSTDFEQTLPTVRVLKE
jgi:hypothetical protein